MRTVASRVLRRLLALVLVAAAASQAAELPTDLRALDAYLQAREASHADLRPGSERAIVWANAQAKARTRFSLVYLHGFSASRREVAPLCDLLAQRLGANLYYARLPGHGRSEEAMGEATLEAWLREGEEALAIGGRLGERPILIGTSTGGTLATWLASQHTGGRIAAVVLLSPNFGPRQVGAGFLAWPGGVALARLLVGDYRSFQAHNPEHARHWTTRYPIEALKPMMQLVDRVEALELGRLSRPLLVLYSKRDQIVRVDRIERRFLEWGAPLKQLQAVATEDPDGHVLAGDILSPGTTPGIVDAIDGFLRGIGLR